MHRGLIKSTAQPLPSATTPAPRKAWSLGRGLKNVWLWVILALMFTALQISNTENRTGASVLWFLDPWLTGSFAFGLWLNARHLLRSRIHFTRRQAVFLFIFLSWLSGMVYELSLSQAPGSFGGMHPDTAASFLLAQGYYVPFAVLGWLLIRRYQLTFQEAFFAAGAASLYEAASFGLPAMIASPMVILAPLVLAYYVTVYALFLTWPLLFIDERLLWRPGHARLGFGRKVLLGSLVGLTCWLVFVAWGALLG